MFIIAVTDVDWFTFLREQNFVHHNNFWTPSPWSVSRLSSGDRVYFMLKSPVRKLGGYGEFIKYTDLTLEEAWIKYGYRNGCQDKSDFVSSIGKYANLTDDSFAHQMGSIELSNCVFWSDAEYKVPEDYGLSFSKSIVKFKYFDQEDPFLTESNIPSRKPSISKNLNDNKISSTYTQTSLPFQEPFVPFDDSSGEPPRRYSQKQREGQSQFKSDLLKAYNGRCCITQEQCPELLEGAHIQPYIDRRSNNIQNGLLLRVDFHKLYDSDLLYIDENYKIWISSQVEGQDYRKYNGQTITLPTQREHYPSIVALQTRKDSFRE